MTREEWLKQKHRDLDKQIEQISETSMTHYLLADLKKQKLALKDELEKTLKKS